jgi:hypothetical protein
MEKQQYDDKKLVDAIQNFPRNTFLIDVPNFGIFHLSVAEAAELVVIDLWFSGQIEIIDTPDDFTGSASDQWLNEALADPIVAIEARLRAAIDTGKLKASAVRRDIDDRLIAKATHIAYDDLMQWMKERGLNAGDHIGGWLYDEAIICELICDEVAFLRNASTSGELNSLYSERNSKKIDAALGMLDESGEIADLQAALRAKVEENRQLREELDRLRSGRPATVDRPLHTRQRRTLLSIIAALCTHSNIHYAARGAAQRIKNMTELIGAPIDDGTIDKVLKEIPDALETRLK